MHSARYAQIKKYIGNGVEVKYAGSYYATTKYKIIRNDPGLSDEDLAIICDKGNLPFGFRREGDVIYVYID